MDKHTEDIIKHGIVGKSQRDIDVILSIINILDTITLEEREQLDTLIHKYRTAILRKGIIALIETNSDTLLRDIDDFMISKEPKPPTIISDINKGIIESFTCRCTTKPRPSSLLRINESKYKPKNR